jgi:membrane protease subunit HflC
MSNKNLIVMIGFGLVVMLLSNVLFVVKETEKAVMLKFGKLVKTDIEPGLHAKVPFMNKLVKFDARILTVDAAPADFLNSEKKAMRVDSFIKWRIANVEQFYTVTSGVSPEQIISQRVNEGLRNAFADLTLHEVVSGKRDELMSSLTKTMNVEAQADLGMEIIDIRIKRVDLPDDVSGSVFDRMRTEREREAREHRSKGKEQAEVIKADADRQRTIIEAEAYRDSEKLRGEGDAKAAATYANAYSKDAEFYAFTRSLNAYKATFSSKEDVMLIDPNSDFFRYLKDSGGEK